MEYVETLTISFNPLIENDLRQAVIEAMETHLRSLGAANVYVDINMNDLDVTGPMYSVTYNADSRWNSGDGHYNFGQETTQSLDFYSRPSPSHLAIIAGLRERILGDNLVHSIRAVRDISDRIRNGGSPVNESQARDYIDMLMSKLLDFHPTRV